MWLLGLAVIGLLFVASPVEAQQTDRTRVTIGATTVGTSSLQVLAANENRNFLLITNDHATNVLYCAFDATAVLNTGIRINGAGGAILFDAKVPIGALTCIATAITTPALTAEGTK